MYFCKTSFEFLSSSDVSNHILEYCKVIKNYVNKRKTMIKPKIKVLSIWNYKFDFLLTLDS